MMLTHPVSVSHLVRVAGSELDVDLLVDQGLGLLPVVLPDAGHLDSDYSKFSDVARALSGAAIHQLLGEQSGVMTQRRSWSAHKTSFWAKMQRSYAN